MTSAPVHRRWKYGHMTKVAYRKWHRAQRRRWLVYLRDRNWMEVYSCRWTHDLLAGETGSRHWHIGHRKGSYGPAERVQCAWRRLVLWRYYRLRHRYRVARGTSQCRSASCKAHRARSPRVLSSPGMGAKRPRDTESARAGR